MQVFIRWLSRNIVVFSLIGCAFLLVMWPRLSRLFEANNSPSRKVYQIGSQLQLALGPIELENVPIDKAALRAAFPNPAPPGAGEPSGFSFLAPGESRLKDATRYHDTWFGDDNAVSVVIAPWTPKMYAEATPAMLSGLAEWQLLYAVPSRRYAPTEYLGMQCVRDVQTDKPRWIFKHCLWDRGHGEFAVVAIAELPPLGPPNPDLRTQFFTKAYGGLTINLKTHPKHAAKLKEIDAKVWRLISQWNLAAESKN